MKKYAVMLLIFALALGLSAAGIAEAAESTAEVVAEAEASAPELTFALDAPEAAQANETIALNVEETRAEIRRLKQEGRDEEAAALQAKLDAYLAAEQTASDPTAPAEPDNAFHVARKKTANTVTAGESFQIVVDGKKVKSYKVDKAGRKFLSVSGKGLATAKLPGTAKVAIHLKSGKKWTLTVKVRPDPELSGLLGGKFTDALAAVGGKKKDVIVDGKDYDNDDIYGKQGIWMFGLHSKKLYAGDPYYKRVYKIALEKSDYYRILGIALGDTAAQAREKILAAGYEITWDGVEDGSGVLNGMVEAPRKMMVRTWVEGGVVTEVSIEAVTWA